MFAGCSLWLQQFSELFKVSIASSLPSINGIDKDILIINSAVKFGLNTRRDLGPRYITVFARAGLARAGLARAGAPCKESSRRCSPVVFKFSPVHSEVYARRLSGSPRQLQTAYKENASGP